MLRREAGDLEGYREYRVRPTPKLLFLLLLLDSQALI